MYRPLCSLTSFPRVFTPWTHIHHTFNSRTTLPIILCSISSPSLISPAPDIYDCTHTLFVFPGPFIYLVFHFVHCLVYLYLFMLYLSLTAHRMLTVRSTRGCLSVRVYLGCSLFTTYHHKLDFHYLRLSSCLSSVGVVTIWWQCSLIILEFNAKIFKMETLYNHLPTHKMHSFQKNVVKFKWDFDKFNIQMCNGSKFNLLL